MAKKKAKREIFKPRQSSKKAEVQFSSSDLDLIRVACQLRAEACAENYAPAERRVWLRVMRKAERLYSLRKNNLSLPRGEWSVS